MSSLLSKALIHPVTVESAGTVARASRSTSHAYFRLVAFSMPINHEGAGMLHLERRDGVSKVKMSFVQPKIKLDLCGFQNI
jgi:hypothetical protein